MDKHSSEIQVASSRMQKLKFMTFSLVVALIALASIEFLVRVSNLDNPELKVPLSPFMLAGFQKVTQSDDLLFYSLRPNIEVLYQNVAITTNSHGLRSSEIEAKGENEYRILSIGESSSFGAGVEGKETYAAVLNRKLDSIDSGTFFHVINAGVPAYSSYQGRRYFEERGLKLNPDMLLVYHELADFLPTANREFVAPRHEGLPLTDQELAESQSHSLNRWLLENLAIFRFISKTVVNNKISVLQSEEMPEGAEHLTIPDFMMDISTPEGMRSLKLPQRVSLKERANNFRILKELCAKNNIQLVIIHPSYSKSKKHECDLTEFCTRNDVVMFDAYESLHPEKGPESGLYWDLWHPDPMGQQNLGDNLFHFLMNHELLPLDTK